MRTFIALLFLGFLTLLFGVNCASANEVRGKIITKSIDGETACFLKLDNGKLVDLGYLEEIARRDNISCIINNIITDKKITLIGELFEDNGNLLFVENDFECAKDKSSDAKK